MVKALCLGWRVGSSCSGAAEVPSAYRAASGGGVVDRAALAFVFFVVSVRKALVRFRWSRGLGPSLLAALGGGVGALKAVARGVARCLSWSLLMSRGLSVCPVMLALRSTLRSG